MNVRKAGGRGDNKVLGARGEGQKLLKGAIQSGGLYAKNLEKSGERDLDKNCFAIVVVERVAIYRSIANFYANFWDRQFSYYQKILSTFPGNVAWHRAQSRSIYEAVQIVSENEKK